MAGSLWRKRVPEKSSWEGPGTFHSVWSRPITGRCLNSHVRSEFKSLLECGCHFPCMLLGTLLSLPTPLVSACVEWESHTCRTSGCWVQGGRPAHSHSPSHPYSLQRSALMTPSLHTWQEVLLTPMGCHGSLCVELFGACQFLPCLTTSGYKPCHLDEILGFLGSGTVSSSSCLWKNCTQLQRGPDSCSESGCFREVRGFVTL